MTTAIETLRFRLATHERISAACAAGNISPWAFLSFRPEKMRLRVGESFLRSQIPVIFADDLADRLTALLPPTTTPATPPIVPDKEGLKRLIALAQIDADIDVRDVIAWGPGADAFLRAMSAMYLRFFNEARAPGSGEETAAFFQLVAASSLRNVMAHTLGTNDRFLGLAALLASLSDRALSATVQSSGDGLSGRLGLLMVAACSPLSLMGTADAVVARPGNVYRTLPAAFAQARDAVRAQIDRPRGLNIPMICAQVSAQTQTEPGRRRDLIRTIVAEAVRDLSILSTLTQGTELADIAGRSEALVDALYSPLGKEKLQARLQRHPRAGQEPLVRLSVLVDSIGAILAGDLEPLQRLGSIEQRADLAAQGAVLLALDEVALERASAALDTVRPVADEDAADARAQGKAYRFSLDDEPLYLLPQRRDEAFLFADMKDFTKRTAAIREEAMGDFPKAHFYEPILGHTAHLARQPQARVSVINLLGDAVATRGDIVSHIAMAVECRRLVDEAAADLHAAEQALRHGGDDILDDITREITKTQNTMRSLAIDSAERQGLEVHLRQLQAGRAERLHKTIGAGLEAGVFITWGREANVIEVGFPEVGDWKVVIAEQLNAAARGTSRSASLVTERNTIRVRDEARLGRALIDPFFVHTSADPEDVTPTTTFHNAGAALTGDALQALQAGARAQLRFQPYTVPRTSMPQSLQGYWWARSVENFMVISDADGVALHLLRFTGRTVFRGLEQAGPTDVWELMLVDRGVGRDFIEGLRHAAR